MRASSGVRVAVSKENGKLIDAVLDGVVPASLAGEEVEWLGEDISQDSGEA